ncbi:hypothetical protein ACLI4Z_15705 [Natrialbaceae archaeon A-arb3/5]
MSDDEADEVLSFDALLEEATDSIDSVEEHLGGVESIEELDDDVLESVLGDVETLTNVAAETEELIETIDFGDLPEAVDGDELLTAIEAGEIPAVLSDEDAGVGDLVDFSQLFRAIDLLNAWDATDLGDLWEEKRELEGAVDALADDSEDASMVEEAAATVADEGEALIGGEGGMVGGEDDLLDDADLTETLGDIDVMEDPEAYQIAIQQQAMTGIDAFRTALLETHEKFERLYEFNREKMRRQDTSTNSRNPTATSTMPTERAAVGSGVKHTTVPQDVRLSTAPSRRRIYGHRFKQEREKRRHNDD